MASFDFAPLALRYAQDERLWGQFVYYNRRIRMLMAVNSLNGDHSPFVLSVAERQRSEVEGRHDD